MCRYCEEDYDGYYTPLDKNAHVCIFDKPHEKILDIDWYGHKMKIPINYCPKCRKKIKKGGQAMTKEQEAIKRLKSIDETVEEYDGNILKTDIETVLNMLEKKDKIFDLMAEQLAGLTIWNNDKEEPLILADKEEVKQYFERKSEEC